MTSQYLRAGIVSILVLGAAQAAGAAEGGPDDQARLTVGVPIYVGHPDERINGSWNQGWLQNEGVLVDATWPVYKFGDSTNLRAGVTLGGFDNSVYRTSLFAGADVEV